MIYNNKCHRGHFPAEKLLYCSKYTLMIILLYFHLIWDFEFGIFTCKGVFLHHCTGTFTLVRDPSTSTTVKYRIYPIKQKRRWIKVELEKEHHLHNVHLIIKRKSCHRTGHDI